MKVKDLQIGYPIYHIKGYGAYGCKGDIITNIIQNSNNEYVITIKNERINLQVCGIYYAKSDDDVELIPDNAFTRTELFLIKLRALLYRLF